MRQLKMEIVVGVYALRRLTHAAYGEANKHIRQQV